MSRRAWSVDAPRCGLMTPMTLMTLATQASPAWRATGAPRWKATSTPTVRGVETSPQSGVAQRGAVAYRRPNRGQRAAHRSGILLVPASISPMSAVRRQVSARLLRGSFVAHPDTSTRKARNFLTSRLNYRGLQVVGDVLAGNARSHDSHRRWDARAVYKPRGVSATRMA